MIAFIRSWSLIKDSFNRREIRPHFANLNQYKYGKKTLNFSVHHRPPCCFSSYLFWFINIICSHQPYFFLKTPAVRFLQARLSSLLSDSLVIDKRLLTQFLRRLYKVLFLWIRPDQDWKDRKKESQPMSGFFLATGYWPISNYSVRINVTSNVPCRRRR